MASKLTKQEKKNILFTTVVVTVLTVIGILLGDLLFSNIEAIPPVVLFLGCTALVLFSGIGISLNKLNKFSKVNLPTVLCYLPVAQDIVVYSVVKASKTKSSLHEKLKQRNYLSLTTVLIILSMMFTAVTPTLMTYLATNFEGEDAVAKILGAHTTILATVTIIFILAYIVRCLYFNFVFKAIYKCSTPVLLLAVLPPVHLVMIICLQLRLNKLLNDRYEKIRQGRQPNRQQRRAQR